MALCALEEGDVILGEFRAKWGTATCLRAGGGGEQSLGVGAEGGQAYWTGCRA